MVRSIKQIHKQFIDSGISIAEWARDNEFSPDLVYRIFRNNKIPKRGESHKIAVKLGIKDDRTMN